MISLSFTSHYPVDIRHRLFYPLDSDLSMDQKKPYFEQAVTMLLCKMFPCGNKVKIILFVVVVALLPLFRSTVIESKLLKNIYY